MWINLLKRVHFCPLSFLALKCRNMNEDKTKIWHDLLESVKVSVSPAVFSTWISQTHLSELSALGEGRFLAEVGCHTTFVKATVETRYFGLLQDALTKILGKPCDLTFLVKQNPEVKEIKNGGVAPLFEEKETSDNDFKEALVDARVSPYLSFDRFAVSASNQMAWAAAQAVAEKPGTNYNPLFIWGGVGVGKSHLMNAVGLSVLKEDTSANVLRCTGEEFTNDIVEGIRNKTTQAFRNKYRKLTCLMVDDIQFIAGKEGVQEEFFHTFNAVTSAGGQVILTSDRPPTEIKRLEDRLRSRFEAGLIVDIAPPDFELRCAITQIKAADKGLDLPSDLIHLIAGNIEAARQIEGFLVKLMSQVKLKKIIPDADLIKSLLNKRDDQDRAEVKKRVEPDQIVEAVCKYYSISRRAMLGKIRARLVARPRQILMYLLRTEISLPLIEVGRVSGGRDHSTVIHAVDTITRLASDNVKIREDISGIKKSLWG